MSAFVIGAGLIVAFAAALGGTLCRAAKQADARIEALLRELTDEDMGVIREALKPAPAYHVAIHDAAWLNRTSDDRERIH